jgi:hypothetical protein
MAMFTVKNGTITKYLDLSTGYISLSESPDLSANDNRIATTAWIKSRLSYDNRICFQVESTMRSVGTVKNLVPTGCYIGGSNN